MLPIVLSPHYAGKVKILLVFKDDGLKQSATTCLKTHFGDRAEIMYLTNLQEAIEHLEQKKTTFDFIVFEQRTPRLTIANVMFPLANEAKFILCVEAPVDLTILKTEFKIDQLPITSIDTDLPKMMESTPVEAKAQVKTAAGATDDFISVTADAVASYCPLNHDVYIQMNDGRYVKLFHKGDPIEVADFERYQKQKGVSLFYFKKNEFGDVLNQQVKRLDKLANTVPLPEKEITEGALKTQAAVRDIIEQMGFTPEAQALAKSCVAMTAKLLSSKPKLSKILSDLKKKEGAYVGSHSISVGTVACAIADKMNWHSVATYFKLSLAAFMHDITLEDKLAKVHLMTDVLEGNFSQEEINKIKLHPVHAADYVRKMSEIPADVDQIVFQHHERGDGSGFPRSLSGKFISPLSSVFIVAHDLVNFMTTREGENMRVFLIEHEELYKSANFRKVWLALKTIQ